VLLNNKREVVGSVSGRLHKVEGNTLMGVFSYMHSLRHH